MQASERSVSLSTLLRPRNLLFFGTFVGQLSLLPYTEWEISAVESAAGSKRQDGSFHMWINMWMAGISVGSHANLSAL